MNSALVKINPMAVILKQLFEPKSNAANFLPLAIRERVSEAISRALADTFCIPLQDEELTLVLPHLTPVLERWRRMSIAYNYAGPVVWLVREGFSLRIAPRIAPCLHDQEFNDNLDLYKIPDDKTSDKVVFWIPLLLPNTLNLTKEEQARERARVKEKWGLPEHHLSSPGSAEVLLGLCMTHFQQTQRIVLGNNLEAATATTNPEKDRVITLACDSRGFRTGIWDPSYCPKLDVLGCFPIGEEQLD